MPTILLVDDDKDTWETVGLALEPGVKVHAIGTLAAALSFLKARSHEVSGVIIDLNLTDGSDNFGRELLQHLRETGVPCIVFSSSIKSQADAERYANEFGVLGTIGKGGEPDDTKTPLEQLREGVQQLISASIKKLRDRKEEEVRAEFSKIMEEIRAERRRSADLAADTSRVAGTAAARKLEESEALRIGQRQAEMERTRDELLQQIRAAATFEELSELNTALTGRRK